MVVVLAALAGVVGYALDRRGRRTAIENLTVAFGDRFSPARRRSLARRSYQTFARTFLDLFWTPRLTEENVDRHISITYDDPTCIDRARRSGSIWITPHYGNFEWAAIACGFKGFPNSIPAEEFKNPLLTGLFRELREHSGNTIIPQERAMLRLFRHVRRGGHAAIAPDLTVPPTQAATIIRCFGLKTSVSVLHAALAERTDAAILPGCCTANPDGSSTLRMLPAIRTTADDSLQSVAQRCWDVFEPLITEHPERWLWMYKHWRYLPEQTEGRDYPSYANRKKRFDKLDRELRVSPVESG
jgi:lauroyl/myristoyl acyltransferase